MPAEIYPFFDMPDKMLASALSEPFLRPQDFIMHDVGSEDPSLEDLAGMTITFLNDEEFPLECTAIFRDGVDMPLAHAQNFVNAYPEVLKRGESLRGTQKLSGLVIPALGKMSSAEARMLAAGMVFSSEDGSRQTTRLVVARKLTELCVGLDDQLADAIRNAPEISDVSGLDEKTALLIGSMFLLDPAQVVETSHQYPAIAGFFDLTPEQRIRELHVEKIKSIATQN